MTPGYICCARGARLRTLVTRAEADQRGAARRVAYLEQHRPVSQALKMATANLEKLTRERDDRRAALAEHICPEPETTETHTAAGTTFKALIENDNQPKGTAS